MNRLYQRFQDVIESSFHTTLYKTDIYHPFDFRDSDKIYYVVKLYIDSYDDIEIYIDVYKITIANKSYKDVHFIFSLDDGFYMWTYSKNNINELTLKGDIYVLDKKALMPL